MSIYELHDKRITEGVADRRRSRGRCAKCCIDASAAISMLVSASRLAASEQLGSSHLAFNTQGVSLHFVVLACQLCAAR